MYDAELIDRNLHPMNRRIMEDATVQELMVNSSCGDEIMVFLKIEEGVIVDASWEGYGCAISQVSADMMMDTIRGEEITKVKGMTWEDLPEFAGVRKMPARVKCAGLAWQVLEKLG